MFNKVCVTTETDISLKSIILKICGIYLLFASLQCYNTTFYRFAYADFEIEWYCLITAHKIYILAVLVLESGHYGRTRSIPWVMDGADTVSTPWASCQICKIAGCARSVNAGNVFPAAAHLRSRQASRHVRDARAVMHAGITNKRFPLKSVLEQRSQHSRRMRNPQFLHIW